MAPLQINVNDCHYQAMIGVGGIGAGRFFSIKGNHTLRREESRGGHFLPGRDYCKLHIISHYVKTLLGPEFATLLIGKVGDDEVGHTLLKEMKQTGLDTRYVQICESEQTLYSLCLIYPDNTGGNLTTDNSACTRVNAAYVNSGQGRVSPVRRPWSCACCSRSATTCTGETPTYGHSLSLFPCSLFCISGNADGKGYTPP